MYMYIYELHTANTLEVCLQLIAGTTSAEQAQRVSFASVERYLYAFINK